MIKRYTERHFTPEALQGPSDMKEAVTVRCKSVGLCVNDCYVRMEGYTNTKIMNLKVQPCFVYTVYFQQL